MVRELRRFNVRGDGGPEFPVVEVATFHLDPEGREVQDGVGTLLTYDGSEVFPTGTPGEFLVVRTGAVVRTA